MEMLIFTQTILTFLDKISMSLQSDNLMTFDVQTVLLKPLNIMYVYCLCLID